MLPTPSRPSRRAILVAIPTASLFAAIAKAQQGPNPDARHIDNGWEIYSEGYADQPYVVQTADGAWLACATIGSGREGQPGQHVATFRSRDLGRTWSKPTAVEPPEGPEASYAVMLPAPTGRVYIFYNHNTDNIRRVRADKPAYPDGWCMRVDSLGYFVFKYSDDHGRTWSAERYPIPVREFEIDRNNAYGGKIRFFWNVGKAFSYNGAGYVPLIKVGGFGEGFFTSNEGALLRSPNILTEPDPTRIEWQTLPEGDIGLRAPAGGGPIAGEQSYCVLSDGSFFCVYRTIDGHPAHAYSRDEGRTWDAPQYLRYASGRLVKHPRAANFAWRTTNGNYLYWFHNHGGRFIREHPRRRSIAYEDRNPVWLSGGVERDSAQGKILAWSEPEIALYHDDPLTRMSYPDLVEEDGRYFLTETEKATARVHEVDPGLLAGMWGQLTTTGRTESGLSLDLGAGGESIPKLAPAPALPAFRERSAHRSRLTRSGFTVEADLALESLSPGQILATTRGGEPGGWELRTTERGTLVLILDDGRSQSRWDCDPGLLRPGGRHYVTAIADGGPSIITFVVDGVLCDGGDHRQFGWGRFQPGMHQVSGGPELRTGVHLDGRIHGLRVYGRALPTSEAVANFRAARGARL